MFTAARRTQLMVVVLILGLVAGAQAGTSAHGLAELYGAALRSNPNLKQREFDVDRARAQSDGARSRLLPQVSSGLDWTTNGQHESGFDSQRYEGRRARLGVRQILFDSSAVRLLESAKATISQREQELVLTRSKLFDEVLDRYLQALYAQDTLSALDAESKAAVRQVDRLRAMRERQMARITDLSESEAYALGLVTRAIDARNEQATALARLTELSGEPVTHVVPLVMGTFDPVNNLSSSLVGDAVHNNPRLLALAQAVEAARREVEASSAEHLPQLAATLSHVYSNMGYDNRRGPAYNATSLGIELRVPLYEGGRVSAAVRDRIARLGTAEQQLEAARREIEREVMGLWSSAQANQARMNSTAAEVLALEQTVQAQERALELGVSRVTDVLIARQRLLKAMADRAKARYDYVRDITALTTRTRELTNADVAKWDLWFKAYPR